MRNQNTAAATAARKVPDGWQNIRVQLRVRDSDVALLEDLDPIARGEIWRRGLNAPTDERMACLEAIRKAIEDLQKLN